MAYAIYQWFVRLQQMGGQQQQSEYVGLVLVLQTGWVACGVCVCNRSQAEEEIERIEVLMHSCECCD